MIERLSECGNERLSEWEGFRINAEEPLACFVAPKSFHFTVTQARPFVPLPLLTLPPLPLGPFIAKHNHLNRKIKL